MSDCIFCQIVKSQAPAKIVDSTIGTLIFEPLNPVVRGHVLVIPQKHVDDFTTDPDVSADVMHHAARYAREMGPCNIITSRGRAATQSVFHLHLHIVPRAENDGLALPWYSGKSKRKSAAS